MSEIRLVIFGVAPSKGNSYRIAKGRDGTPRLVKGHNHGKGDLAGAFEGATLRAMLEARVAPIAGPVTVEAVVYPPHRRRDIPGVEKVLLDALQNWRWGRVGRRRQRRENPGGYGCYADDKQVMRFLVEFGGVDKTVPRIEVLVKPWVPLQREDAQERVA